MSREIQWTIFATLGKLSNTEIAEIMDIDMLKPLHEAFMKELWFRWPELRDKSQLGITMPKIADPADS